MPDFFLSIAGDSKMVPQSGHFSFLVFPEKKTRMAARTITARGRKSIQEVEYVVELAIGDKARRALLPFALTSVWVSLGSRPESLVGRVGPSPPPVTSFAVL